jgi:hypothetical protein
MPSKPFFEAKGGLMSANTNTHIARLHRFLPFSAAHDQIYEEYQTGEDNLDLETVAIAYATKAIRSGAKCVILTGDAGHGKTHMCRRLLESELLGYGGDQARRHLQESCSGNTAIPSCNGSISRSLRIHKDLSEIQPPSRAARFLEDMASTEDESLVVCANEGRLRAIISSDAAGPVCSEIGNLLRQSFKHGITASTAAGIHIINLNYQSVAAKAAHRGGSLLRRVLKSWVGDGRRWGDQSCGSCSHKGVCPIRRNRTLLVEQGVESENRVRRIEEIFEVVERLGHVVTIREMLMLVAYLITGGLTCSDVDRRLSGNAPNQGWQHAWAFYNLLFRPPPNLPADRAYKGIPLLAALRRLDPGSIAVREIDERLLNRGEEFSPEQLDLQFLMTTGGKQNVVDAAFGIDDFNGNPQNRADLIREAEASSLAVGALRRRAFFDAIDGERSVMLRLGFRFGDVFLSLLEGNLQPRDRVRIKNTIIAGLHAIQGLRIARTETMLYLVDPAFGKASADAAIIARQIPSNRVNLQPASIAWHGGQEADWFLPLSVDWIDRTVILQVDESLGDLCNLSLDLLAFECVARAASGYVSEDFYANEIRHVRTFLGQLAERARNDSAQISIFMRGQLQNVSLDIGVIQVGGE